MTGAMIVSTGIPTNGRTCQACFGTGSISFSGEYWRGGSGVQMFPRGATAGPFYMFRCRDTGAGMWPPPDVTNRCQHCSGTGVMGPNGEPVRIAAQGDKDGGS